MHIHLINPSDVSFGAAVITPRWLYVLAAATPAAYGDPQVIDETLEQIDLSTVSPGDVIGIGIHTLNALRGYEVGRAARERGAYVVYGGIHSSLFPGRAVRARRRACRGQGRRRSRVAGRCSNDCKAGTPQRVYEGGKIEGGSMLQARWDLLPRDKYMIASVQTVRGCPKHCSFCSVWRTDGQKPRVRESDAVIEELVAAAAARLPVRRARRRQLLSGHARRFADGGSPRRQVAPTTASRRFATNGSR